jgi:hypothetical protein
MDEFSASYYAGTIVHELCHIATDSSSGRGYVHNGNKPTASNQRSAPYRVGDLVSELAEKLPPTPAPPVNATNPNAKNKPSGPTAPARRRGLVEELPPAAK